MSTSPDPGDPASLSLYLSLSPRPSNSLNSVSLFFCPSLTCTPQKNNNKIKRIQVFDICQPFILFSHRIWSTCECPVCTPSVGWGIPSGSLRPSRWTAPVPASPSVTSCLPVPPLQAVSDCNYGFVLSALPFCQFLFRMLEALLFNTHISGTDISW